jgi:hypothetical protein
MELAFFFMSVLWSCLFLAYGHGDQGFSSKKLSEFENALHEALNKQRSDEEDNQRNENRNQGLINTIVNHNNKLKMFENKFNLVVNNFANSSHVKEVHERTNELERLVLGAPQPHKSRRELLLLAIVLLAVLFGLIKITKRYVIPRWIKWLNTEITKRHRGLPTISGQVTGRVESGSNQDPRHTLERHLAEQKEMLEHIINTVNMASPHDRLPVRDRERWERTEPNRSIASSKGGCNTDLFRRPLLSISFTLLALALLH